MPKLPTYEELGSNASGLRPAPAALRSVDAARAPGDAVAGVGLKMMDMATQGQQRKNAAQFARDRSALTVLDITERRRSMEENPYKEWDEKYRLGYSEKAQEIIRANPNADSRAVLQGEFNVALERGSGFMDGEAFKMDVQYENARTEESLDRLADAGIENTASPADYVALIESGIGEIDAQVLAGTMTETAAVDRRKRFKEKMAFGFFKSIGDPKERIRQLKADVGVADFLDDTLRMEWIAREEAAYETERVATAAMELTLSHWGNGLRSEFDAIKDARAAYKEHGDIAVLNSELDQINQYARERQMAGNEFAESILDSMISLKDNKGKETGLNSMGEPVRVLREDPLDAQEMFYLQHTDSQYIEDFARQGGFPQVTNEKWYTAKRDEFFAMSLQEKRDEFDNLAEYGAHLAVADYRVMRAYIEEARYGGGAGIDNMDSGMNKFNERFGAYPIDDQDSESDRFDMHEMLKRDFQRRMMVAQSESEGKMSDEAIFAELDQTFKTVIIEKPWYKSNEEKLMLRLNIDDIEYDNIPENFRVQWGNTPRSQVKEEYINYLNEQDFGFSDTIDQQTGFVIKRPVGVPEYRPGGSLTNKINSAKAASETATDGE